LKNSSKLVTSDNIELTILLIGENVQRAYSATVFLSAQISDLCPSSINALNKVKVYEGFGR
jgi:hypothetical protein